MQRPPPRVRRLLHKRSHKRITGAGYPCMLEPVAANSYRLLGHIDMQESSSVLRELMDLPQSSKADKQDLLLDVSALESADSLLLAALLDLQRKLEQRGSRLRVTGLSESMRGLALVYGIESLLGNMLDNGLEVQK
jgi:ABC-type transporter Mla MlaB component